MEMFWTTTRRIFFIIIVGKFEGPSTEQFGFEGKFSSLLKVEGWYQSKIFVSHCYCGLKKLTSSELEKRFVFCLFSSDPQRERVRCWVEIVKQFLTEFSLVEQSSRGQVSPRSHSSWTIKLSWHVRGPGLGLALKTKRTLQHQISAGDLQGKPRKGKKYAIGGPPKNSILFLLFCLAVA